MVNDRIYRSINDPIRDGLSWAQRWKGKDRGLITCWEIGRKMSKQSPGIAERARCGELPVLDWKGGVEKQLKTKEKYGTFYYLAQLQGLRGDDLDIDVAGEQELVCSKTEMKVIFTSAQERFANSP